MGVGIKCLVIICFIVYLHCAVISAKRYGFPLSPVLSENSYVAHDEHYVMSEHDIDVLPGLQRHVRDVPVKSSSSSTPDNSQLSANASVVVSFKLTHTCKYLMKFFSYPIIDGVEKKSNLPNYFAIACILSKVVNSYAIELFTSY